MEVAESGSFKIVGFSDLSIVFLAEIKKTYSKDSSEV